MIAPVGTGACRLLRTHGITHPCQRLICSSINIKFAPGSCSEHQQARRRPCSSCFIPAIISTTYSTHHRITALYEALLLVLHPCYQKYYSIYSTHHRPTKHHTTALYKEQVRTKL